MIQQDVYGGADVSLYWEFWQTTPERAIALLLKVIILTNPAGFYPSPLWDRKLLMYSPISELL